MASHTEEQRVFIVRRLAVFDAPEEIIADFKRHWPTTDCQPADIAANDPRRGLTDEKLIAVFNSRRKSFLENNALAAPTSDQQVRLIELHNMFRIARDRNLLVTAAELLEQIAKEIAGFYAGKGKPDAAAPTGTDTRPIGTITYTIIDPAPVAEAACKTDAI